MFESHLGCWGCLIAVNLLNYLETSSLQRVNNIPKLQGVVRLMLRKTGQQAQGKKLCDWRISRAHCSQRSKWRSLLKITSWSNIEQTATVQYESPNEKTRIKHTVFPLCSRFLVSLDWLPQILKKIRNQRKQNLEDEANNMQLDKEDVQRSNLIVNIYV